MIRRNKYDKEFRERIVMEILSGQRSIAQIAQREQINPQTIRNWKKEIGTGSFEDNNQSELALRKRVAELEGALAELALDNHILKKAQKYLQDWTRKEKLSGSISHLNSESIEAAGPLKSASPPSTTNQKQNTKEKKKI